MDDRTVPGIAGTPHHVVHRRNDGSSCFFSDEDYLVYLDCLKEEAELHGCSIHAYVLMPDHVQLLASLDSEPRLSRVMRCVGGRYVEYLNYTYQRNGAFWEHGVVVTPVRNEQDLLDRYCVIEATPVRARLVASPADYRWSSHRHHACGSEDTIIREHPLYLRLGTTQLARQLAYHELFRQLPNDLAPAGITTSADRVLTPGGDRLEDGIEQSERRLAWRVVNARAGGSVVRGRLKEMLVSAKDHLIDSRRAPERGAPVGQQPKDLVDL